LRLWRICKRKYAPTAFSGEGANRVGGRWNSPGHRIVYTSATLSLAALETFVHMEVEDMGTMLAYVRADVPTEVKIDRLEISQLPSNWRQIPAPSALADIGNRWFTSGKTAILAVPSAIMPIEYNYLVNPSHPDFAKFILESPQALELDPRLWKTD
jgi:RES domain-containing protein